MKKTIYFIVTAILLIGLLSSCKSKVPLDPLHQFTADNEILTYEKIDSEKTQLVVARVGNVPVEHFCRAYEKLYPEIQVIYLDITGGDVYVPLKDWAANGIMPDILFSTVSFDNVPEHLENLSASPVVERYTTQSLDRVAVDANIYWLPGPSQISCMTYNKKLFEQYGWSIPNTFDEFVALCLKIKEDTNGTIQPWNPNAKYNSEFNIAAMAFTYEELFGGAENRLWYNDFTKRTANWAEHMGPYYDMLQTLIDNDILIESQFKYSATTRGNEFLAGKIAMINGSVANYGDTSDFVFFPFPTTKGNLGYLCDSYSCLLGVPKKEHTEKEQKAIDEFIDFFSTDEGQTVFINNAVRISNLNGTSVSQEGALAALQPAIEAGHMFEFLKFLSDKGRANFSLYTDALDMTTGKRTGKECLASVDANPYTPLENVVKKQPEVIATVTENMTMLETSFLIADAYRESANADIGLIVHGEVCRGNLMRLFAGDINSDIVFVLKPRSFANKSALTKVSMTGQQLLDTQNSPVTFDGKPSDTLYAYSGLKCEIAPWNKLGEKYLSVKLADGTDIDPSAHYTVAFWAGTVADKNATDVLETYEESWTDMMTSYLKKLDAVSPANDGRVKLIWK